MNFFSIFSGRLGRKCERAFGSSEGVADMWTAVSVFFLSIAASVFTLPMAAQTKAYYTHAEQSDIASLRVRYLEQEALTRPYLVLQGGVVDGTDARNTLEVSFDAMTHDVRQFTYTVYHLNADYTPSDLQSAEYLQGFTTADITEYELSNLTQRDYTHYSFTFPNNDMQIVKSGNYVLHIYEDGNPDKTVADVCFAVVEPIVGISASVRANTTKEINGRYQQLDIDLDLKYLSSFNPQEITLVVQQNNRQDNAVVVRRPTYIESQRLRYINSDELIFEGGNEYRHFDTYSSYYAGYNVNRIRFEKPDYHAFLEIDDNRGVISGQTDHTGSPYIQQFDTDGQWVTNIEQSDYDDTDAEYMWVHFMLPMNEPFFDGSVYVGGDLFGNRMTLANRMQYDNEQRCYYLSALLKQGGYDYQYWFVPMGQKKATLLRTEGSHWQTENTYTLAVYYRPIGSRYDRLVGYRLIRSGQ
ncbi:MAG: DUF5103 domain-containing protein [Paludibacteraceae bacterium]|nr:DUF5103 domain-containing protein [Paludibacteraceae bacterium]